MFLFLSFGLSAPTFSVSLSTCDINGDGEVLKDNYRSSGPYQSYTIINIGTDITKIGDQCFEDSQALQTINFVEPSKVESIGFYSFNNCFNLLSITFPDSVKSIKSYALRFCNKITYVPLGSKLESIGIPVLYPDGFKGFIVSPNNPKFCNDSYGCLYNKEKTILYQVPSGCDSNYRIPQTVDELHTECFHDLVNIQTIYIPNNVKKFNTYLCNYNSHSTTMVFETGIQIEQFPEEVFIRWIGLESIELPESITMIPSNCFQQCSNLKSIFIPSTVSNISSSAFTSCTKLNNITISKQNPYIWSESGAVFSVNYSELLMIPTSIEYLNIPKECTTLPTTALQYATKLINVTVDPENTVFTAENGLIYTNNFQTLYICIGGISSVSINESTITINSYAFNRIQCINEIDLSNTKITTIGKYSFQYSSIVSIKFPKTLSNIQDNAFDSCSSLSSVEFPDDFTNELSLSAYVFQATKNLKNITLINIQTIKSYCFTQSGVETIQFAGSSLKIISACAFTESNVKTLHFPDSLQTIETQAFLSCSNLQSIVFGKYIETIKDYAFSKCKNLVNITFPNDCFLNTIGQGAFASTALITVDLPSNISDISYGSFEQCNDLISVNASNQYFSSSDGILYNANSSILIFCPAGKTKADIHCNVEAIGTNAFYGCEKLQTLTFPMEEQSSLKEIGENTFYHCISLENVTFPDSLEVIERGAFEECINLKTLIFGENGKLRSIGANIFHGCESLKTIHLPINGVLKEISAHSFENCLSLQEITIPNSVTKLCDSCFLNCQKLLNIVFILSQSQLQIIETNAFNGCESLKSFNFPSHLETIGSSAFVGTSLQNVKIPEGLTSIGESCFNGCPLLTIHLPSSLNSLGNDAFSNCQRLRQVFYCGDLNFSKIDAFRNTDSRLHINVRHLYEFNTFSQRPVYRTLTENCVYIAPITNYLLQMTSCNIKYVAICLIILKK